jgi:hypothetical protein
VQGVTDDGEILFQYANSEQGFTQRFGFNLKYYRSHTVEDYRDEFPVADGAYIFKPDLDHLYPFQYSALESDVQFEHGKFIDQWTFKFSNASTKEYALVKVRYSQLLKELIEFEVELKEIPVKYYGKDVTVNWRMYDDFKANKTFWTDSNGLEMQQRRINYNPSYEWYSDKQNISSNYYPVDSAIAIRDSAKHRQVTVMNDRAQGGSAELWNSTIELMQNRRLTQDDNKGVQEILNETDVNGVGINVTAKYFLQIFDLEKGQSKQREHQLRVDNPLQYFFAFDYLSANKSTADLLSSQFHSAVTLPPLSQGVINYQAFPLAKGKILLRVENIADRFDLQKSKEPIKVNVKEIAMGMYLEANRLSKDERGKV